MFAIKFKVVLLFFASFFTNKSFQATVGKSIASVSVTTGHVGQTITLRCEAPDFKLDNEKLDIYFTTDAASYLVNYITESKTFCTF